jgi:prepilin-type N-terminal cleavage/methylation domain-containing protein
VDEVRKTHAQAGFTLLELLAVLTLASIALVFVFLRLDGMTAPSRLASAGREIANLVGWVRGEAAAQARDIEVEFDLDNARYRVIVPPRPGLRRSAEDDSDVLPWTLLPDNIRFLDIQFTPNVSADDREDIATRGTRRVTFTRSGGSPSFVVHLESSEVLDPRENKFSVEVNGFTGATQFEVGYKEFGAVREEHELR